MYYLKDLFQYSKRNFSLFRMNIVKNQKKIKQINENVTLQNSAIGTDVESYFRNPVESTSYLQPEVDVLPQYAS
jgi:hypothetical protein